VPWTPSVGAIGLTSAYGWASVITAVGQFALTDPAPFTHALVVLDGQTAMEPWPNGARHVSLADFDDFPITYITPSLNDHERSAVAAAARSLDGVPYRVRDYQALALWRLGWHGKRVGRTVADSRYLLPGQFVAETYRRAGRPLFDDAMDVTVGDLGTLLIQGLLSR
jgi:hypothetical protein